MSRNPDPRRAGVAEAIAAATSPWNMEALHEAVTIYGPCTVREACAAAGLDHHTFTRTATECVDYNLLKPTGELRKLGPVYTANPPSEWYHRLRPRTDDEIIEFVHAAVFRAKAKRPELSVESCVRVAIKYAMSKDVIEKGGSRIELPREEA